MEQSLIPNELYHITKRENWYTIELYGVRCETITPTGKKRLYAVDNSMFTWGCEHIAKRHHITNDGLIVAIIPFRADFRRYKSGIWYAETRQDITSIWTLEDILQFEHSGYFGKDGLS